MKKIVFIDVDNTIAKLIEHYIKYYNDIFMKNEKHLDTQISNILNTHDFREYTLSLRPDSTYEEEFRRLTIIFNSRNFWKTVDTLPNVKEILPILDEKYEIYLLTAPSFKSPHFFSERLEWVQKTFPKFNYEKLIFCKNKSLFRPDSILIDDYPVNLINWRGKSIKVNYKYNEDIKTDKNFYPNEWERVPELLKELE